MGTELRMIDEDFRQSLLSKMSISQGNILFLRELLIEYKEAGMDKNSMMNNLIELRSSCNSDVEDVFLDLMDFVTGFCNSSLRIF
ncbi:hypothetical protein QTL86_06195 [Cellulosilyticum sp. ST5]|uniref:Uncharacterized protein n=1 Tax=Cellulosilyticum lentocellum (strain ATCC 49066 / DSM 5427 / NCIMB 11756 / RHM5) TaxID=642492 RepID=F2JRK5_CELLD|nr:hypothetical protein [Cellulosilyticum lentocellum]ADZ83926.1 hypothetical protein Clole_2215 [Cellulosilyticum lentocellum DSM 5427]